MRLAKVQHSLIESIPLLNSFEVASRTNSGTKTTVRYRGIQALIQGTRMIEQTGVLKAEVSALWEVLERDYSVDTFTFQEPHPITTKVGQLKSSAENLIRMLNDFLPEDGAEASLSFLMPDSTSLSKTADTMKELERVLGLIVTSLPAVEGTVELRDSDRGSFGFEIYLGTIAVVSSIGLIVDLCFHILERHIHYEKKLLELEADELAVDTLKVLHENFQAKLESEYREGIDGLDLDVAPEDRNRIGVATKELMSLIERGMKIEPVAFALPEEKVLFPSPPKQLYSDLRSLHDRKLGGLLGTGSKQNDSQSEAQTEEEGSNSQVEE